MGIFNKVSKNISDYKESKKNPTIIKGERISVEEMRKAYFKKHPASYFKRMSQSVPLTELIIVFGKEGFWLNEIIMLNINKDYEEIRKTLFEDDLKKSNLWTEFDGEYYPLIKINKSKFSIKKKIKLP